ncbi:5'-nucleotidase /3'-nucleotidase /exopolyphosphatase [Natronoarchaeum philippinense]|uniref:5'-nucleotidase SurE n=1 Tax=Natronoarchaeum philippinense TaxID=558529 RepID=A0A285NVA2_NATPI|nr:5'/3'-nucleotidase SurE [Natronoarchaeum philippinense]SNZ13395.1 5'-nucleotidase /3'-nucleotidase /exopolyphosphatase [Natronoarchaeum philippinense]
MDDSEAPEILLTNDDGIGSAGIGALHDALDEIGNVTVVAPADDQSAVGRAMSTEVGIEEHERGYAIAGTPSDCVVAGLEAIGPYPDLVVSGCNRGANLGEYVLGRSGTVSAAVEAAFFGIPSIAVSLYVPTGDMEFHEIETDREDYAEAVRATEYLVEHATDAGVFEQADYLNVNAPLPGDEPAPMTVTRPSHVYDMDATHNGDTITLHDRIWDRMAEGDIEDPEGTDRRAVVDGRVSVSPLTAPHTTEHHEALDEIVESYPDR